MRNFFKREKTTPFDELIAKLLKEMDAIGSASPEYPKKLAMLEKLYALKAKESREPISKNTMAIIAGNLVGILLIVAYEQKHVLQSKGLGQLIRPKID